MGSMDAVWERMLELGHIKENELEAYKAIPFSRILEMRSGWKEFDIVYVLYKMGGMPKITEPMCTRVKLQRVGEKFHLSFSWMKWDTSTVHDTLIHLKGDEIKTFLANVHKFHVNFTTGDIPFLTSPVTEDTSDDVLKNSFVSMVVLEFDEASKICNVLQKLPKKAEIQLICHSGAFTEIKRESWAVISQFKSNYILDAISLDFITSFPSITNLSIISVVELDLDKIRREWLADRLNIDFWTVKFAFGRYKQQEEMYTRYKKNDSLMSKPCYREDLMVYVIENNWLCLKGTREFLDEQKWHREQELQR